MDLEADYIFIVSHLILLKFIFKYFLVKIDFQDSFGSVSYCIFNTLTYPNLLCIFAFLLTFFIFPFDVTIEGTTKHF